MFKQIKQIIITLMAMFKVNPASPNEVPGTLMCTQRRGTPGVTRVIVELFILRVASLDSGLALCEA